MADVDEQGLHLSRRLQRELGELYTVTYSFTFAGYQQQQALLDSVADEPLPGWSCHADDG